jgi:hypothetical protein
MKIFKYLSIALLALATTLSSCTKEEGEGGDSTITGKIWVKHYNPYTSSMRGEYWGAYRDVYIIYGDNESYGERTETNPEGAFEFRNLRPGNYKIYTYSKNIDMPFNPDLPDEILIKEVEIGKKETVDAGTFEVGYYKL